MTSLAERLSDVDARIASAIRASGRAPSEVHRIVVTKFHPASLIRDLYDLGVRDIAENRPQEIAAKHVELAGDLSDLRWHFVGQLQTNKARSVRSSADLIHSVDRERLVDALVAAAAPDSSELLDVLIQVNLTADGDRGGVRPEQIEQFLTYILDSAPTLRVRGVMGVAPLDERPESAFARLADSAAIVRANVPGATWISAGMSGDFSEAIHAGATHLRIGSAITGPRPPRG